jgi:hypothetical protein
MRKKRMRKDEKREVTPEFVNMSKEILYPQIQGVTNFQPNDALSLTKRWKEVCCALFANAALRLVKEVR